MESNFDIKQDIEKKYNEQLKQIIQGAPAKKIITIRKTKKKRPLSIDEVKENVVINDDKKEPLKITGRLNEKFIDLLDELSTLMAKKGENIRAGAYKKAQESIMLHQDEINETNYQKLSSLPRIGNTIIQKFKEYIETGTLRLLERERANPENIFSDIFGIGPKKAKNLVEKGITTIQQLREKQEDVLNDLQKTGLKYYEDILQRIPRNEIDEYKNIFDESFNKLKHDDANMEIVGSYRRGAKTSGDIDVIITSNEKDIFKNFIDDLLEKKIIVEVLTRGASKSLVITKLPGKQYARRVDFLYTTKEEFPFAILYFTGSKTFNTVMRGRALTLGYSLNEHGMYAMDGKKKGSKIDNLFSSEKDIFQFLKME